MLRRAYAQLQPHLTPLLLALFAVTLLFRFGYVFTVNPLDYRFSDPGRHWMNGIRFFNPDVVGSGDPVMYQAFVHAAQRLFGESRMMHAVINGTMSALVPFFWYKALRELLPQRWALLGGIAIGWCFSLIMIFSLFMNETLLLVLQACAVWLSLRALRLKHFFSYCWAAFFWAAAVYTRSIALPMALVFLGVLLLAIGRERLERLGVTLAFFIIFALPGCWHSMLTLKFCAPLGNHYLNEIYYASGKKTIELQFPGNGRWGFSSPSYHMRPLAPLSDWKSARDGVVNVQIDVSKGREDWKAELARVRALPNRPISFWQDFFENSVMLYLAPSWPDNPRHLRGGRIAVATQWLWLPLFITAMWMAQGSGVPWRFRLLPGVAALTMLLLMLQTQAIMEGRYRKPVEPLLIASFVTLLYWRVAGRRAQSEAI